MKIYLFLFSVLFFCRTETSAAAQWKWTVSAEQLTEEMADRKEKSEDSGIISRPEKKAVKITDTNAAKATFAAEEKVEPAIAEAKTVITESAPAAEESEPAAEISISAPDKTFFSAMLSGLSGQNISAENLENMFEKIDADQNGFLSEDELFDNFQQTAEISAEEKFLQLDSNGDDKISENEFLSQYRQESQAVDDGVSESQEIYEGIIEESKKNFQSSDTDGDGFLSLSELQHFMLKTMLPQSSLIFHAVDSDEDGKISQDEFAAFFNMGEALKGSVSE